MVRNTQNQYIWIFCYKRNFDKFPIFYAGILYTVPWFTLLRETYFTLPHLAGLQCCCELNMLNTRSFLYFMICSPVLTLTWCHGHTHQIWQSQNKMSTSCENNKNWQHLTGAKTWYCCQIPDHCILLAYGFLVTD